MLRAFGSSALLVAMATLAACSLRGAEGLQDATRPAHP